MLVTTQVEIMILKVKTCN
uniref:Uncharacterized protein n=1 Tax=Anguilla anguilla TaxID=7936 RepID=A0A0E9UPM0_ANGAN